MSQIHSENKPKAWKKLNDEVIGCRRCPRLVAWREEVAVTKRRAYFNWEYWGKPVPGFGDPNARILIVGLAPGAHGSNRTGRMFTGDASGNFLYPALYRAGFASQPVSERLGDALALQDIFITAVGRCAPPKNKPKPDELRNCQPFLLQEIALLENLQGIIALGKIAYDQIIKIYRTRIETIPIPKFAHAVYTPLGSRSALADGIIPPQPAEYPNRPPDNRNVRSDLDHRS